MKETLELRVNYDYAHLLFEPHEGRNIGSLVKIVEISKDDPRYNLIPIVSKEVSERYDRDFFFGWQIKRKYTKKELDEAKLFHFKVKPVFEPTGEECGTLYDETVACEICGANAAQIDPLYLKKETIPKKDIAKSIGGEVVMSEKLVNFMKYNKIKGILYNNINFGKKESNFYQLKTNYKIEMSPNTLTGDNPFEKSINSEGGIYNISGYEIEFKKEVYFCPKGHLIGLNLLSEPYVLNNNLIGEYDFFESEQKIGVRRGLLRPEPIYFCSPAFKKMVDEEKLTGFEFEIAHID